MVTTPFGMYLAHRLNQRSSEYYPEFFRSLGKAAGIMRQCLVGIDTVKSFILQRHFRKRTETEFKHAFSNHMKAQKYVSLLQPVCGVVASFPRYIAIIFGAYLVLRGDLEIGSYVAVYVLLEYVVAPAVSMLFVLNAVVRAVAASNRVQEIESCKTEPTSIGTTLPGDLSTKIPALELEMVHFEYENGRKILDGVSFVLPRNDTIAIVSASGEGKSTIINLICRLYEISAGRVLLHGTDVRNLSLDAVRRHVTVLSQDAHLFPGSLEENIRHGNVNATDAEVQQAIDLSGCRDLVERLPEGLKTDITEFAGNLSGGEKQKIAITMAFLKDSPVLVLDEPTASLDTPNERDVVAALKELVVKRSVLALSHKIALVSEASTVFVLRGGRVVESGPPDHLLGIRGEYYSLFKRQIAGEPDGETHD